MSVVPSSEAMESDVDAELISGHVIGQNDAAGSFVIGQSDAESISDHVIGQNDVNLVMIGQSVDEAAQLGGHHDSIGHHPDENDVAMIEDVDDKVDNIVGDPHPRPLRSQSMRPADISSIPKSAESSSFQADSSSQPAPSVQQQSQQQQPQQQQLLLPSLAGHEGQTYIPYSLGDESRGGAKSGTFIIGGPRRALFDRVFYDDERVFLNLLANEERYMPTPLYFRSLQPELKPFMRKMVVDWMLEVCDEQRCDDDVFALAVNYFDRFLSLGGTPVAKNQLQLLGAVSMFIASKLKESQTGLSGEKLVIYTDNSITLKQLFDWELLLLSKLRWDMAAITPLDFLDQLLWRMWFPVTFDVDRVREIALCVALLTYTDHKFSHYPPSMIAATCITFAVHYLREADESKLLLPHPASVTLSPAKFKSLTQSGDSCFPYRIQWCFADSRFPAALSENSLFNQLQSITSIEAECLRQCHQHIAQLVHSACGQATLSTIKGGVAGFPSSSPAPSPSPSATPTDIVEVSRLIDNPMA